MKYLLAAIILGGLGLGAFVWTSSSSDTEPAGVQAEVQAGVQAVPGGEMVAVTLPELSAQALRGQNGFQAVCAACHGPNAGGLEGNGPPLVHSLYVPGHHSDMAIVLAAQRGVQSHHWRFGNMPPVEGLTDGDLKDIIAFIRAVQVANGIS